MTRGKRRNRWAVNKEAQTMKSLSMMRNNKGAALVIALLVMMAASVVGVMSVTTSSIEVKISGNDNFAKQTFYAAEAAIENIRGVLKTQFVLRNAARIAARQTPNWDFALLGPDPDNPTPATDTTYAGGTSWINNAAFGSYTYSVRIWNNPTDPSASPINDKDRLIYARADASGSGGSARSIEVILEGDVTGDQSVFGYSAQAGGGVGKNYNADDLNPISDFSGQVSGVQ